ncbi:MAG: ATP-binding protein [Gammaproteobacteria bacterium]|nr:ATP-binding protein [Gammaproteobacteria bacterium]MCF6361849.1 ATP-binding protein [Gammaproteobacteria bacterium]
MNYTLYQSAYLAHWLSLEGKAEEFAAFANAKGGYIILGVDNKTREVTGIQEDQIDAVQGLITRASQDSIASPLNIYSRIIELPDQQGNQLPVIYVQIEKASLYAPAMAATTSEQTNRKKRSLPTVWHAYLSGQNISCWAKSYN